MPPYLAFTLAKNIHLIRICVREGFSTVLLKTGNGRRHAIFSTFVLAQKHPFMISPSPANHPREFRFYRPFAARAQPLGQKITWRYIFHVQMESLTKRFKRSRIFLCKNSSRYTRIIFIFDLFVVHYRDRSISYFISLTSQLRSLGRKDEELNCIRFKSSSYVRHTAFLSVFLFAFYAVRGVFVKIAK